MSEEAEHIHWAPQLDDQTHWLAFYAGMRAGANAGMVHMTEDVDRAKTSYALLWGRWVRETEQKIAEGTLPHQYQSTACQHSLHEQCRKTCKTCEIPCSCRCHLQ